MKSRLLKNYFSIVILSKAKNLCAQFEKKNEILLPKGWLRQSWSLPRVSRAPQNDISRLIFLGALMGLLASCSQLKNETTPVSPTLTVHGVGFKDTTSANFHGIAIRTQKQPWNIQGCKSCHGQRYDGGTAQKSCLTCHTQTNGPENCTTCHGGGNARPWRDLSGNTLRTLKSVGAHQAHLVGGSIGAAVACTVCHTVPLAGSGAGHIDNGVTKGKFDTTSVFYRSNASYTSSTATCSNTYCHGNFSGGNNLTMSWTDTSSTVVACGTCHGDVTKTTLEEKAFPKNNHAAIGTAKCYQCHSSVVDANLNFTDKSRHINGAVNFN